MKYIRGFYVPAAFKQGVATIGNFDGMHIGHQVMIQMVIDKAKSMNVPSLVVVFEPQPQEFFQAEKPTRLMTLREKAAFIQKMGVDALVILPFNKALAELSAESFIQSFLKESLNPRELIIGHDFGFGKGRAGNTDTLRQAELVVTELAPVMLENERVSSTAIRQALANHDLLKAEKLLGRRYSMEGKVRKGAGRGRAFGFPTANISPKRNPALRGVYAVTVKIDGTIYAGVANLGTRPTVCGVQTLLEVNLFDWESDLYGERLEVTFIKYIRGEQKFPSLEALQAQIAKDVEIAKDAVCRGGKSSVS